MAVVASSALILPFIGSVLGVTVITGTLVIGVLAYRSSSSCARVSGLAWCGAICGAVTAVFVFLSLDGLGIVADPSLTNLGWAALAGLVMGAVVLGLWAFRLRRQ